MTAIDRLLQNEPRTSSRLAAVVELCLIMLCARGASVSRPQGWTAAWCPSAAAACLLAAAWSNSCLGAAHRSAADVSVAAGGAASTSSGCSSSWSAACAYGVNELSASSCGAGRASNLSRPWPEPSRLHRTAQPGCAGRARPALCDSPWVKLLIALRGGSTLEVESFVVHFFTMFCSFSLFDQLQHQIKVNSVHASARSLWCRISSPAASS